MKQEKYHYKNCLVEIEKPKTRYYLESYCPGCQEKIKAHNELLKKLMVSL